MSYTPATLAALGNLWRSWGGTNLGVVGSTTTHCAGYHLGRDRIFGACACRPGGVCHAGQGAADYSVHDFPARDGGAHCTNAAMAIDLGGAIGGDAKAYDTLAKWLIAQCQAGAADTADIRAINYETLRYDKARGVKSPAYVHNVNEAGHIHIEWYRDSETRDKTAAIKRWKASLPVKRTVACSGGYLWSAPNATSTRKGALIAGEVVVVVRTVSGGGWDFPCNGSEKKGTAWYEVSVANGVALSPHQFAAVGRF